MRSRIGLVLAMCGALSLLLIVSQPAAAQNTWPLQSVIYQCGHRFPNGDTGHCTVRFNDLNGSQTLRRGKLTTVCGDWTNTVDITVTKPVNCPYIPPSNCTIYELTTSESIQCKKTRIAEMSAFPRPGYRYTVRFDECFPNGVVQWCHFYEKGDTPPLPPPPL